MSQAEDFHTNLDAKNICNRFADLGPGNRRQPRQCLRTTRDPPRGD